MPTLTLRPILSILQILLFTPSLLYAYSFHRTSHIGGFTIGVFSLLRLIGSSTRLAKLSHPGSDSLSTATYICESLGIILLIFLYQEFLERINKMQRVVHKSYFTVISAVMLLDLALAIGSWVTMSARSGSRNILLPTPWTTASSALIFAVFVYEVGVFVYFFLARKGRNESSDFGPEERRLLLAPAIMTLPMVVRNMHPLIFVGTGSLFWNQVVGNGVVYACMIFAPEVLVIATAVWCIRGVRPLGKEEGKAREDGGGGQDERASESQVPLQGEDRPRENRQSSGETLRDRAGGDCHV
ncbi:unnamed protein product [Zymoseptoria tritici ST99CH_1A5]|uniref:DUF7702 domain-containing protein n=1 Tax=Zymoseptoria tritici ST99CH_1A5 TaxID=1276529 RepID=A0A1Y6L867_ZYMTR|nr:unnamed protein product [Zymoseptoria tritici ST99CH_1A5]